MPEETPTQGVCAIDDDLINTKVVLWEMIQAHQGSAQKSREQSANHQAAGSSHVGRRGGLHNRRRTGGGTYTSHHERS